VLGDLLNQIPQDERINSVYTDGAYDTKQCRQVIADFFHSVLPKRLIVRSNSFRSSELLFVSFHGFAFFLGGNVSDSQVLGDLLNQIPQDERINSVYTDGAYDTKHLYQYEVYAIGDDIQVHVSCVSIRPHLETSCL
jgi:hypothetical protein